MRALNLKLVRDLGRLWAQALAVAVVMACGVATLILANGAYRSLEITRGAYYERYRFGDVFGAAVRAPKSVKAEIAALPGVAAVETRIVRTALLDIPDMREPATGIAISVPDIGELAVNGLFLREGRLPHPGATHEVVVNENFARAQRFALGSRFAAIFGGSKLNLTVVGVALSPEYVYNIGPGDLMPDDRRFGVLWMSEKALAATFDLEGAFNSVSLRLQRGADEAAAIDGVDRLLERYGGTGAYGRKDQISNAFLDGELTQLYAMARVIPPIFLLVSAFLVNMILGRLVALEREQIGLLKAVGYSPLAVAWHYQKLTLAIAGTGILIGFGLGTWLGYLLTELYTEFFSFPFLIYRWSLDTYLIAAAVTAFAATLGALNATRVALALPAAVAMQPPAPTLYRRFLPPVLDRLALFTQPTVMAFRHIGRNPIRTALATLGTSFAVALQVTALFSFDSVDFMIDAIYFRTERQDATLAFSSARAPAALSAVRHLPGVLAAEPYRSLPVEITHGHYKRKLAIVGKPPLTDLSRVLDLDLEPVRLPETGIAVGDRVAEILRLKPGDMVQVEVLEGRRRVVEVPVTDVIKTYLGLMVFMNQAALDRLAMDGPRISGVHVSIDRRRLDSLYAAVKETPEIAAVALQTISRQRFRETMAENITITTTIYVALSVAIAFGVLYNSVRIQLSERARELATLRVLGFRRGEVSRVLFVELAVIVLLAQPLGWLLGWTFAWLVALGFSSDLFRMPLVVETDTFAWATVVVIASALVSALIVRRRVNRLDLVRVLKTRD